MCGHVGIAGKLEFADEATFKRLLLFDYLRGTDSTGIFVLRNNNDTHLTKIASHPLDLFETKAFGVAVNAYQSSVFLGHNRAATKGKVTGFNAHPYEYGHIFGAHNGTLTTESWKALEDALGHQTDVDSMAIFACIEKLGIEETVRMLQGAWALVWYDMKEGTLNFLRNKEREFWYAYEEGFKKLLWASEWPMIQGATALSKVKYDLYTDKEGYSYFATTPDWHYKWNIEELRAGGDKPLPRVKELKGKEPAPVVKHNYAAGSSPFYPTSTTKTGITTSTGGSANNSFEPLSLEGTNDNPWAGVIEEYEFEEMAKHSCGFCMKAVDYEEPGNTIIESTYQVLCPDCSGRGDISRVYADTKTFLKARAL